MVNCLCLRLFVVPRRDRRNAVLVLCGANMDAKWFVVLLVYVWITLCAWPPLLRGV